MFKKRIILGLLIFSFCQHSYSDVYAQSSAPKIPVVYSDLYNIRLENFVGSVVGWGLGFVLPKIHPFDGEKYGKVYTSLIHDFPLDVSSFYDPLIVTDDEFVECGVHAREYLDLLKRPAVIAAIAEIPYLSRFSVETLERALLVPMRLASGGTLRACQLALEGGWAVNLSGGYHHAKKDSGSGFCFFADIPYAICSLWKTHPHLKILIIDLDAHQGNGNESFFADDSRIAIFDVYNRRNYPRDVEAAKFIRFNFPVEPHMSSDAYLNLLYDNLLACVLDFKPDLIIYNAGTDILAGDRLGGFDVSAGAIIERDQHVFEIAATQHVPIAMVLSGGYSFESAGVIARSLERIFTMYGIAKRAEANDSASSKKCGLLKWFSK